MKLLRILGAEGEVLYQERMPDAMEPFIFEYQKPRLAALKTITVVEIKQEDINEATQSRP